MIPTGIFLISNLKSYNIPAVVQCKGTVRGLDLFSRVFLNEAKRQGVGLCLLNTNTLTLCDYVLRPTSKWSLGWEKPKLKAENHQSQRLSFFRCFLKIEYAHDAHYIPRFLKAGDSGNALMKRKPQGVDKIKPLKPRLRFQNENKRVCSQQFDDASYYYFNFSIPHISILQESERDMKEFQLGVLHVTQR